MNSPCPTREEWQALLNVSRPDSETARLEEHLNGCESCRRLLDQLAGHGTTTFVFAAEPVPASSNETLDGVINRLKGDSASTIVPSWDLAARLQPTSRADALGQFGEHIVLEIISQGGMAAVVKALDPALDRLVAIKILSPSLAMDGSCRERFLREARAAAAVHHDNIIVIHAVGEQDGLPFIVMQYIDGPTLQEWIDQHGPMQAEPIADIGRQVAAALAVAHARGLVHRDIKPSNILLEAGPARVRVADFGLVYSVSHIEKTEHEQIAGTPAYMSPEQAQGRTLSTSSDLFSLGVVMFAMGTGHPPFQASSLSVLLREVGECRPDLKDLIRRKLPAPLEQFIVKLLSRDPAERPASAAEVEKGLAQFSAASRQSARPFAWAAAAIVLLLIVLGLVLSWHYRHSPVATKFVVSSSGHRFTNLNQAVEAAKPGDTIEIYGNTPVKVEPIQLEKPLRLRAAMNSVPEIWSEDRKRPIITTASPLVLEGLTLRQQLAITDTPPLIEVSNAVLQLKYCLVQKRSGALRGPVRRVFCIVTHDAPSVELDWCEIVVMERYAGVFRATQKNNLQPEASIAGEIRVANSLVMTWETIEIENRLPKPFRVVLESSLLVCRAVMHLGTSREGNDIQVEARSSLFNVDSVILTTTSLERPSNRHFRWTGQENRFCVHTGFVAGPNLGRYTSPPQAPRTLEEWAARPNIKEVDSQSIQLTLREQYVDFRTREDWMSARDLKVPAQALPPRGPDLTRVGPGEPYRLWRASPEYQTREREVERFLSASPKR